MIDHLLSFPNEATAFVEPALAPWIIGGGDGPAWDCSRCFPGVDLVVFPLEVDAEGNITQARVTFPGWWLVISSEGDAPLPALTEIEPHRLCAWREAGQAGAPFLFQDGLRADPGQIAAVVRIDGLPAGCAYAFDNPRVIGID